MGETNNIDEETYSLIFSSLKHPIRRRILRMLADKSLSYSEILEAINIDSGHLSYHLENLGDLTVSNDGHYQLSSFGEAAVKLMEGVEENAPKSSSPKLKQQLLVKVIGIVLALALIGASFHLINYATITSTNIVSTENMLYPVYSNIPLTVGTGETFEFNITIAHRDPPHDQGFGFNGGFQDWTFNIPRLESDITGWDEAQVWVDSKFNLTSLMTYYPPDNISVSMWNNNTQSFEMRTVQSIGGLWLSVNPNDATNPSNIELKIYTPEGIILNEPFERNRFENRFDTSSSSPISINEAGLYTFKITNVGAFDWNGFFAVNLQFQHFEKPCLYWGIFGFAVAFGYIILLMVTTYKGRTQKGS